MEDREEPLALPSSKLFRGITLFPASRKLERRSEHHHFLDFRMPGCVQSGEVAAQAGPDQNGWRSVQNPGHHAKLPGNGQRLEIPFVERRNLHIDPTLGESLPKKLSFIRLR